jgi:N-acetyl-gamma-glutamyl-phosphate reductase
MSSISIAIVGATGYTGVELLRLLASHPNADVRMVTSRAEAGRSVADLFPNLRGHYDLKFVEPDVDALAAHDVVFYATPHATAAHHAPALLAKGTRVIDLSADFRLKDAAEWAGWYGEPHPAPELLADAVYGLPEVNRQQIASAQLIAVPGCYPTATQLGFLPLLDVIDLNSLIADCKSGVSGAGRGAKVGSLFCESGDSMMAYGVGGHRHLPEIRRGLEAVCGQMPELTFVPHLTPMIRGIQATLYARLTDTSVDLQGLFEQRYANEPFVDVLPAGQQPQTRSVRGINTCRIAVTRPQGGDVVVVSSVIDNLVKGAAGQAVQNFNLAHGLAETAGLEAAALLP